MRVPNMVDVQSVSYVTGDKLRSFAHHKYTSFFDEEDSCADHAAAAGESEKRSSSSQGCSAGRGQLPASRKKLKREESAPDGDASASPDFSRPYDPSEDDHDVAINEDLAASMTRRLEEAAAAGAASSGAANPPPPPAISPAAASPAQSRAERHMALQQSSDGRSIGGAQKYAGQGAPANVSYTSSVCSAGSRISGLVLEVCTASNQRDADAIYLKGEDRGRLQFLRDTVDLILAYVSEQSDRVKSLSAFQTLLQLVLTRMNDVISMLDKIRTGKSALTANFDIFELKLRESLEQFHAMFPAPTSRARQSPYKDGGQADVRSLDSLSDSANAWDVVRNPSLLIQDHAAREMWEHSFGAGVYHVQFADFLQMLEYHGVVGESAVEDYPTFVLYLRYFLNYPSDEVITTYKWGQFVHLFGPFSSVAANFNAVVAGQGFLGLINRIQAYEVLTMRTGKRCLLIRFSRTEPEFLAFSYKTSDGKIGHQINKDRQTGKPIPVEEFIRTRFPKYQLVNSRVNVHAILGYEDSQSLCEYASWSAGYLV